MQSTVKTIERLLETTKIAPVKPLRYFSWGLPAFAIVWALFYFSLAPAPVQGFFNYYPLIADGIIFLVQVAQHGIK